MGAVQHYFTTIERRNQQLVIDLPEGVDKAEVEVIARSLHEENLTWVSFPDMKSLSSLKVFLKTQPTR